MITISLVELKRFLSNAKNIKDSNSIPILSYVKLECDPFHAALMKTNLHSFVITEVEVECDSHESVLIEEKVLAGAVKFSKGVSMKIYVDDKRNKVVLDDGFSPTYCQVQPVSLFPAIENNTDSEKVELSSDVLSAMVVAKAHTLPSGDKELINWMNYVYVTIIKNKSYVFGTFGGVVYFKKFKEKIPAMALDPDTVSAIGKYPMLTYYTNGKYDYFQSVGVTYGFIKPETVCPQLEPILDKLKSKNSFIINRKQVMAFCEKVMSINTSAMSPQVSIEDTGNGHLNFKFDAVSDNEGTDESMAVEEKTFNLDKVTFLPKNFLIPIRELSSEKIKISKVAGHMIITTDEEKDYLGSVMELLIQN